MKVVERPLEGTDGFVHSAILSEEEFQLLDAVFNVIEENGVLGGLHFGQGGGLLLVEAAGACQIEEFCFHGRQVGLDTLETLLSAGIDFVLTRNWHLLSTKAMVYEISKYDLFIIKGICP